MPYLMYRKQKNKENRKKSAHMKKQNNSTPLSSFVKAIIKMDQRCLWWRSLCPQQNGSFYPRILTRKSHGTFFWRLCETKKWTKMSEE